MGNLDASLTWWWDKLVDRTRALFIGVDGLDYDVVMRLGIGELPNLAPLVADSVPHAGTFPPDSIPSWTTMISGVPPQEHGQLHSINYLLDTGEKSEASLVRYEERCFWRASPQASVAVLNPFLAHPPFLPTSTGAMISGPSFGEAPPTVRDPTNRLVGDPPPRMGGFSYVPKQRELEAFADETERVAQAQYDYALRQIDSGRFDVVFHTSLTVDRIEHMAWRHFDATDPTHPGTALQDLIPRAHRQLDRFVGAARAVCADDHIVAVFSDHGHGQRASIGVNFEELFRRIGLHVVPPQPLWRRGVEAAKTALLSSAEYCHLNEPVLWLARRVPGREALKAGIGGGTTTPGSVRVPDVGGSNPFGGIDLGGNQSAMTDVLDVMRVLTHRGRPVVRWVKPAEEVVGGPRAYDYYPDLLFELEPQYGPTWNMYGPIFAPIVTHRRISGGHTRRGVFASSEPSVPQPSDSAGIHEALRALCAQL